MLRYSQTVFSGYFFAEKLNLRANKMEENEFSFTFMWSAYVAAVWKFKGHLPHHIVWCDSPLFIVKINIMVRGDPD